MDTLLQDLRYTLRQLRQSPGFATIVVLTLALGIGANSALFGIVNAALLRPLPYPDADRLASVSLASARGDMGTMDDPGIALLMSEHPRSFEALAAYKPTGANLTAGDQPETVSGSSVSTDFFRVMGVHPTLGRTFTADEARAGAPLLVILGHGLWVRDFGSDPQVIGRTVELDDRSYTIVGVMPTGFDYPEDAEYWVPMELPTPAAPSAGARFRSFSTSYLIGRLRPGVSTRAATTEVAALHRNDDAGPTIIGAGGGQGRITAYRRGFNAGRRAAAGGDITVRVTSLHERLYGDLRPALIILLGTVGCVLLIACANVANLLLARAAMRRRELAVRAALGAARWRLARQQLVDSVVLALLGGACGLLLARVGLPLFLRLGPASLTRVPGIAVDRHVLLFTLIISLVTGVLFGFVPALASSRADVQEALKAGGLGPAASGSRGHPRRLLVTAELAVAMVLLIGAGLLVKSFIRFRNIDPGFTAQGVLLADLRLPAARYIDSAAVAMFFERTIERVRGMPGVRTAALATGAPVSSKLIHSQRRVMMRMTKDEKTGEVTASPPITITNVSPDYFRTFGIALRAGRDFTRADDAGSPRVAIIDETMAHNSFPNESAVGRQLSIGPGAPYTVIGVATDIQQGTIGATPGAAVYLPLRQSGFSRTLTIALRTGRADPLTLVTAVRQAVRGVDPEEPLARVATLEQVLDESVAPKRFNAVLLGAFAVLALLLAAGGLYGLIAYLVAQRTHEIGIRMALGAERRDVLALVLRQGLTLTLGGVVVGLVAAFALTRLLASMLFDVTTTDPVIFVVVPLVLIAVSVMATLLPARRAARVDPMIALRAE